MTNFVYDLIPTYTGQKSFYGKARVATDRTGCQTLYSYNVKIMTYDPTADAYTRHWPSYGWMAVHGRSWSPTTGKHIAEFTEQMTGNRLHKAEFMALQED